MDARTKWLPPTHRTRRILVAMRARGMTQNKLAQAMGVSWHSLWKTLRGKDMKVSTLRKLCEALEVSPSYILIE